MSTTHTIELEPLKTENTTTGWQETRQYIDSECGKYQSLVHINENKDVSLKGTNLDEKPVLITYHDVGLTATNCFLSFFAQAESLFDRFKVIHFNYPCEKSDNDSSTDEYLTFDQLAKIVVDALDELKVTRFFAFGVGAGGNIACRIAIQAPKRVQGLILCSATSSQSNTLEYYYQLLAVQMIRYGGVTERIKQQLLARYFSDHTLYYAQDRCEAFMSDLDQLDATSLRHFIQANAYKDDIGERIEKQVFCPAIVFVARNSYYYQDSCELFSHFDATKKDLFICEKAVGSNLITEESPQEMIRPLQLWFQGFGLWSPKQSAIKKTIQIA
eukprot:CAMPEP_0201546532 /NCGR_PEP_ID=MMETSP0173_2-20130828/2765_1 /ASSEMBLY_ACC=CAM_ASM_000268 /TAXON_ID=218659 /ORGANISM="Vexillifera sp., Strain DIVA3 564/2" /LENGTH=328 /DNA_ID=CAMNT_0047955199 /DNA_START=10 /DNA_END=993 /DNA_ORIENTATION=+